MAEKYLTNLYKNFLKFERKDFFLNATEFSSSLSELKLSKTVLDEFFNNYYKPSFLTFLRNVKDLIYSKSAFDFILKTSSEDWKMWPYLKFLKDERIIDIKKRGEVFLLRKDISKFIPKPQTEEEIRKKVEIKLKTRIKKGEPIVNLFKRFQDFTVKAKWDQMPISQGSAIFVVKKILANLPLNKKFLFVGDDDFISVVLGIVEPNIESLVIDADEQLLSCIKFLAKKFNLRIETKKVDIRKTKNLGERFVGFLANPIYTATGVKEFVKFGKNQLGKEGGMVFLEVGDESIGNQFLFLQDFFSKNNLIVKELITEKIYYPWISLYKEDQEMMRRFSGMIDKKIIGKSPKLAASLYIFDYLPFKPKKVMFKKPIYAYL